MGNSQTNFDINSLVNILSKQSSTTNAQYQHLLENFLMQQKEKNTYVDLIPDILTDIMTLLHMILLSVLIIYVLNGQRRVDHLQTRNDEDDAHIRRRIADGRAMFQPTRN